jgi:hypothetical protein
MHWDSQTKYSGGCYRSKPGAIGDRARKYPSIYQLVAWTCLVLCSIDIAGPRAGLKRNTHITWVMHAKIMGKSKLLKLNSHAMYWLELARRSLIFSPMVGALDYE